MKKESMFSIVLCLFSINFVVCMQIKTVTTTVAQTITKQDREENPNAYYVHECARINALRNYELQQLMQKSSCSTHDDDIQGCQAALKQILLKMSLIRSSCVEGIQKDFAISEQNWERFLVLVRNLKNREIEQIHLPIEGIAHDKNLSKSFKNIIKACLVQKGINPKRINILCENNNLGVTSACPEYESSLAKDILCFEGLVPAKAGVMLVPGNNICFKDQVAWAQLYAQAIHQKRGLFIEALCCCIFGFKITDEELNNNKYFNKYKNMILPSAMISLACQNPKNTQDFYAFCATKTFEFGDITSLSMYKKLSKINKYWSFLEWLKVYSSLYGRLGIKKDPTKEFVSCEEFKWWYKNNDTVVCLTRRRNSDSSINPFDVLQTQSFNKEWRGKQDELMYDFLFAVVNNFPVYEYDTVMINSGIKLNKLDASECDVNYLVQKYGERVVKKAVKIANRYASRKGRRSILILSDSL